MQLRSFATSWLIILLVTSGLLIVAELGLRLAFPDMIREYNEEHARLQQVAYEVHPRYLVSLKPNITKSFTRSATNGGDTIRWSTNALGYRGGPLRNGADVRIIVYGDSNIHARFSELDQTFPAKLERYLTTQTQRDIEVINAGVTGFGPDQSLLRITEDIESIDPCIVILNVFADNDFGDIIRNQLLGISSSDDLVVLERPSIVDPRLANPYPRFLLVRIASAVRARLDAWRGKKPPLTEQQFLDLPAEGQLSVLWTYTSDEWAAYQSGRWGQFSHFADYYDVDVSLQPDSRSAQMKVALMDKILAQAQIVVKRHGAKLLVLIEPSSMDLTENEKLNHKLFKTYPEYEQDRLSALVDDMCERLHIDRINLFPVFSRADPETLYFRNNDNHWSDAGQDLAARKTADYIGRFLLR